MRQMTPAQVRDWLDGTKAGGLSAPVLVDVREPEELAICSLAGAIAMPMRDVPARKAELNPDAATVLICHHGMRSAQVGMFLEQQGFTDIINLQGGVAAWAAEVDPTMPTY